VKQSKYVFGNFSRLIFGSLLIGAVAIMCGVVVNIK